MNLQQNSPFFVTAVMRCFYCRLSPYVTLFLFLYKLNLHPEEIFVKTELSLVKGKNEVIFNEINSFLRHKAAHNSG